MALSGSYDNTTTAYLMIKDAYVLCNMVDEDEALSGELWTKGLRKLNELMSVLSTHKGLWLIEDVEVTLTPGTPDYTIGVGETVDNPMPIRILSAKNIYSTTHHIPMTVISQSEYDSIPNKILQSPPLQVYYDRRTSTGELYFWPTGTSTYKTVQIKTQRPVQDFDTTGDNPDFPKEWVLPVVYNLAELLAPAGSVPELVSRKAADLLATIIRYDEEETSIYIR